MIKLDSFYIQDTASGLYQGTMTVDMAVATAKRRVKDIWGDNRPILVVRPEAIHVRMCMAWLCGPEKDKNDDGTHLFVIWFQDDDPVDIINAALKHVEIAGG